MILALRLKTQHSQDSLFKTQNSFLSVSSTVRRRSASAESLLSPVSFWCCMSLLKRLFSRTKLVYDPKPFPLDIKRFYIPGASICAPCPGCHQIITRDLAKLYPLDATANSVNDYWLYCDNCDAGVNVKVRINISLELD